MNKASIMLRNVFLILLLIIGFVEVINHQNYERAYQEGSDAAYHSAENYADKMIAEAELKVKKKDAEIKRLKKERGL